MSQHTPHHRRPSRDPLEGLVVQQQADVGSGGVAEQLDLLLDRLEVETVARTARAMLERAEVAS